MSEIGEWTLGKALNVLIGAWAFTCVAGVSAADPVRFTRDGLEYRSHDRTIEAQLGGRVHLDVASIDNDAATIDDEEVRRARLELSLRLFHDWRVRIDREFTNGGAWRNAWVGYDVNDDFTVRAGNFIAPFSMEDLGSSNETMFMERSLSQALAPGFGLGAAMFYEGRHFGIAGGYFGEALDVEDNTQADKGRGVALRATFNPIERRNNTIHLGVGLERRDFDDGDTRRLASDPEAHLAPTAVSTGQIAGIDTSTSYNLEAAYARGPVLVQGQFISTNVERASGPDLTFDGYYAQIGWVVTGERYQYGDTSGVFQGPTPRDRFGAVEVALRASSLDLTEAGPTRGKADDVTVGVNWYINRNVRLMGNYVHSKVDAAASSFDTTSDIVEGRLAVSF